MADDRGSSQRLADLGWDERWEAYLQVASSSAPVPLVAARVVTGHRGAFVVQPLLPADDVDAPRQAAAAPGTTRSEDRRPSWTAPSLVRVDLATPGNAEGGEAWPPVVGDWVGLSTRSGEPVIATILPRRTLLERPSASGSAIGQSIAANVSIVLIVEPMVPEPSPGRIERFTALARAAGAQAWLVLTKADLAPRSQVEARLASLGRHVDAAHAVATTDPDAVADLRGHLDPGTTAVLVGRSGAGKSTLTNALIGTQLATSAVRATDAKGRHTTTSRQLLTRDGLTLIDTPGVRALGATADGGAIDEAFDDVVVAAASCRYADCSHTGEPGCAVADAVGAGALDPERVERYRRMRREAARLERRQDARVERAEQRRHSRDATRGRRGVMRLKGRR